jgi:DNA-binding transcriptional LysR family regulator
MRAIPIDVVRAFVAVVEARGFTRAAEDLGRSQPTVSLQVKRLEELVEAPLFENAARFQLTTVGSVCLDYGRRLLKLHDEMLDQAARCKAPGATLRIGMPGEFAHQLTPHLESLRAAASRASLEVVTGESDALGVAFRQNALDVAFLVGDWPEEEVAGRWRSPLGWYEADGEEGSQKTLRLFVPPTGSGLHEEAARRWRLGPYTPEGKEQPQGPLRLVVPPPGSALHEAAVGALRAAGRPFEIACASADFAVRSAAAAAGLGVAPMIDGLAPQGVARCVDPDLPALPELEVSLVARGNTLASAARRWADDALAAFRTA